MTQKSFYFEDEMHDKLRAHFTGSMVVINTEGQQGHGPVIVLGQQERIELAKMLLQGTGHEVTPDAFTQLLDSKELADFQNLPTIADTLNENSPFSTPQKQAEKLADFLNAEFGDQYTFEVEPGARKYARISQTSTGGSLNKSVHCFVDTEGNVYKSAGWKAPAKGVRGSVNAVVSGLQKTDPFGGWLYAKAS